MTQPPTWSVSICCSLRRLSAAIITQTLTQKLMNLVHYTIVVSIACSSIMSVFRLKIPVQINIWTGTRWCSKIVNNFFLKLVDLWSAFDIFHIKKQFVEIKMCVNFSNKKAWVFITGMVFVNDFFCLRKQFHFIEKCSFKKRCTKFKHP